MNIIDIIFLAIALAMDCFTVSIVSGVITGRWAARPMPVSYTHLTLPTKA